MGLDRAKGPAASVVRDLIPSGCSQEEAETASLNRGEYSQGGCSLSTVLRGPVRRALPSRFPAFLRRNNDDARMFEKLHCGIERTNQAVFNDTRYGHGPRATAKDVCLYRRGRRGGWHLTGSDLLIS